jgi:hypothetical protein
MPRAADSLLGAKVLQINGITKELLDNFLECPFLGWELY